MNRREGGSVKTDRRLFNAGTLIQYFPNDVMEGATYEEG